MNRFLPAVAVFLLLLAPASHAINLRVLPWDQEIASRRLAIKNAKEPVEIQNMHPTQRTRAMQISLSEKTALLLLAIDKPDKDGNPSSSEIIIPKDMKQPLMLLLPDPKSATGIRPILIDDNNTAFPWASIRLINTTGKKIIVTYEKMAVTLPASWVPKTIKPGGPTRNFEIMLFTPDQLKRPIYSSMWEHRENFRTLAFVVASDNPRLGPISLKCIHEDSRAIDPASDANDK